MVQPSVRPPAKLGCHFPGSWWNRLFSSIVRISDVLCGVWIDMRQRLAVVGAVLLLVGGMYLLANSSLCTFKRLQCRTASLSGLEWCSKDISLELKAR